MDDDRDDGVVWCGVVDRQKQIKQKTKQKNIRRK